MQIYTKFLTFPMRWGKSISRWITKSLLVWMILIDNQTYRLLLFSIPTVVVKKWRQFLFRFEQTFWWKEYKIMISLQFFLWGEGREIQAYSPLLVNLKWPFQLAKDKKKLIGVLVYLVVINRFYLNQWFLHFTDEKKLLEVLIHQVFINYCFLDEYILHFIDEKILLEDFVHQGFISHYSSDQYFSHFPDEKI